MQVCLHSRADSTCVPYGRVRGLPAPRLPSRDMTRMCTAALAAGLKHSRCRGREAARDLSYRGRTKETGGAGAASARVGVSSFGGRHNSFDGHSEALFVSVETSAASEGNARPSVRLSDGCQRRSEMDRERIPNFEPSGGKLASGSERGRLGEIFSRSAPLPERRCCRARPRWGGVARAGRAGKGCRRGSGSWRRGRGGGGCCGVA